MANKHIKRWYTSLVIRKLQIKTTMGYHYTPIRIAKFKKKLTIPSAVKDLKQYELSFIAGRNAKWYSYFGRQFLTKLNIVLLYDPAMTLLGIYPIDLKFYVHAKTCTLNVYSSFIHNGQEMEATKMSFDR